MICKECIHREVCGLEGSWDEALVTCIHKDSAISSQSIQDAVNEIDKLEKFYENSDNRDIHHTADGLRISLDTISKFTGVVPKDEEGQTEN